MNIRRTIIYIFIGTKLWDSLDVRIQKADNVFVFKNDIYCSRIQYQTVLLLQLYKCYNCTNVISFNKITLCQEDQGVTPMMI